VAERSSGGSRQEAKPVFFIPNEGEGLVRQNESGLAYLRAYGWVRPLRQGRLQSIADGGHPDDPETRGWKRCTEEEARDYALHLFNVENLNDPPVGRRRRLAAYLANHDLRWSRRPVPHGPAPWRVSQITQAETQEQQVRRIRLARRFSEGRLDGWIEQAQEGYAQEQSRIDGIQQRASFILGAAGLATTGVLANGSLLYSRDSLLSSDVQIVVGGLLMLATFALAVAAYTALEATMVMFELAQPSSPWQVERRMEKVKRKEEPDYVLAANLLAAQRAEAIGDWKIRQVKRARIAFAVAILFVVLANVSLLVATLLF
jgi:hypothetical protein